jgi:hypothetical protein
VSLVEVLIGVTALVSMVLLALGVESSALRSLQANNRVAEPLERASRFTERVDRELRTAGLLTLLVPGAAGLEAPVDGTPYEEIHFQRVVGFTTAGATYGPERTLRFALDAGEVANAADDDGDGLVDEGSVFLEEAGGPSAVIATGISALSFVKDGGSIVATVTAGIPVPGGNSQTETVTRTVTLRNN